MTIDERVTQAVEGLRALKIIDEVRSDNPLARDAADLITDLHAALSSDRERAEKAEAAHELTAEQYHGMLRLHANAQQLLEGLTKDLAVAATQRDALAADLERAREALRLHKAWADSESTGPDYGGQNRDTHPDGERMWRSWWDGQLDLCDRATKATDAFLASGEKTTDHAGLIARLEAATGPDREIDILLWRMFVRPDVPENRVPLPWDYRFTYSIDAALALVERLLPGWWRSVSESAGGWWAGLLNLEGGYVSSDAAPTAPRRYFPNGALAILIALLRALEKDKP